VYACDCVKPDNLLAGINLPVKTILAWTKLPLLLLLQLLPPIAADTAGLGP
jgi:hypothetical protein